MQTDQIASLDIHCQKTFTPLCPDEIPVPEGHCIVEELNAQAKWARCRVGVKEAHHPNAIWVADEKHPPLSPIEGPNVDVHWPKHSIVNTKGFELLEGLPVVMEYDYYVWQGVELDMHPYGVCYHDMKERLSTGVIEFLKQNALTTVLVGGLATDYCVKVSVMQLLKAGLNVIVNLGACRGVAKDTEVKAIDQMKKGGAKMVSTAKEIEDLL